MAGAKVGAEGAFNLPYRSDDAVRAGWDAIRSFATIKFLMDKILATDSELARSRPNVQAAVDASIEFARKSPDPKVENGLLNVICQRQRRPDAVLWRRGTGLGKIRREVE